MRVASIWAISAWPALNHLQSNWHEVVNRGAGSVLGVALITLLLGTAGHFAHRVATRKGHGPVFVIFWLASIALLFGYSTAGRVNDFIGETLEIEIPAMACWLFIVVATYALIFRFRHSQKLQMVGATFGMVVGGAATLLLLMAMVTEERPLSELVAPKVEFVPKPPRLPGLNVYYIILDAYGGKAGLKLAAGFDNADFYEHMGKRGFADLSTDKSNYIRTTYSLGGIFNLNYPKTDDPRTWPETRKQYPELFEAENPPALVRRLNAAGYTAWHSATLWGGCSHRHLGCLGDEVHIDADYVTQSFLSPTPFGRSMLYLVADHNNTFRSITSRLPTLLSNGNGFFVFGHHMSPHPPFLHDAHCNDRKVWGENLSSWNKGTEQAYIDDVRCVNSQVERMVDVIIRLNPNALIVLQGDHGSAFAISWDQPMAKWPEEAIAERRSFLNLVRAPADCQRFVKGPMGQINTARFVVACVEGREPQYVPEVGYMSTYSEGAEKGVVRRVPN